MRAGPDRRRARLSRPSKSRTRCIMRCSPAARDRLTVAGKLGLPQVLCPGAIEVLVFNEPETVPEKYRRPPAGAAQPADHRPQAERAKRWRESAARSPGACRRRGEPPCSSSRRPATTATRQRARRFHDPEADARLRRRAAKGAAARTSRIVERDLDINDPAFATEAANTLIGLMQAKSRRADIGDPLHAGRMPATGCAREIADGPRAGDDRRRQRHRRQVHRARRRRPHRRLQHRLFPHAGLRLAGRHAADPRRQRAGLPDGRARGAAAGAARRR